MTFLGLVGMIDPPAAGGAGGHPDAARRPASGSVMITGDHPITAEAVARELGS